MGGAGQFASNEKPVAFGNTLVTTICTRSGIALLTTSMIGGPTTSGSRAGATVTCPVAWLSVCGSLTSVTRAAVLLSTGIMPVTPQMSPAEAGTPSGGIVMTKVWGYSPL